MRTENITQELATVGIITPAAARAASSYLTETIDGLEYDRLVATLFIGTLAGSGTLNGRFQHCSGSLSSDSAWADVNASCITSTFSSGTNDSVAHLELRLDQNPSLSRYFRFLASNATSTWIGAAEVKGRPVHKPAKDLDSAVVAQIVVY